MTDISFRTLWFYVADFLQVNWAVVLSDENGVMVVFFDSTSHVFDQMRFISSSEAEFGLVRNGFELYDADKEGQESIRKPLRPLNFSSKDLNPIYSSGAHWRQS